MNFKGHLTSYIIFIGIFAAMDYYFIKLIDYTFYIPAVIAFFLINPDIDKLIASSRAHRWFLTHSIIFPYGVYYVFKYYLDPNKANIFGLILFLPILVHLICDFDLKHLKKKEIKGLWTISFFPLPIRLGKKTSFIWMLINVGAILYYAIKLYGFWY
ncbi:MAG: hypothetical protein ACTSRZ_11405 [Promethearchaeota archaeon]